MGLKEAGKMIGLILVGMCLTIHLGPPVIWWKVAVDLFFGVGIMISIFTKEAN